MAVAFTTVTTDDEILQILELQRQNSPQNITNETLVSQGFVTVQHTPDLLRSMNQALPQIIAKDQDRVVGYALVMPQSFQDLIPVLKPMFVMLDSLSWKSKAIPTYSYYVMGQICVAESHRGQGIFDGLYAKHKEVLSSSFELCITEIAVRNTRSMRAHERVGFELLHNFQDATDDWNLVVWDWRERV
ncbi:MAG: GNAT family N-acetyltransferase [Spirosomataceae bacterium]